MIGIERARAFYLLCGAALLVAFTFGNVTYAVPFQFYGLALFAIILWLTSEHRFERIMATARSVTEPINAVPLAGMVCLVGILFYVVARIQAEMAFSNLSRGATRRSASTNFFLDMEASRHKWMLSEFVTGLR